VGKIEAFFVSDLFAPAELAADHIVDDFDCGYPVLNHWLYRVALQNQQSNAAMTFVVCRQDRVVGFYSLAVGAIDHEARALRAAKFAGIRAIFVTAKDEKGRRFYERFDFEPFIKTTKLVPHRLPTYGRG